ncbi:MAG: hypothetical protein SFX73_17330 [Kofleriaceae bacterium]|nr:hypothetical protein [Kofleriaceae bacterium]
MKKLPTGLQVTYIGALVWGALLGCCGAYGTVSLVGAGILQRQMGAAEFSDPVMDQALQMQSSMLVIGGIGAMLQLGCSALLLAGGGLGVSGRALGRIVTLVALGAVVLASLVDFGGSLWSMMLMRDMAAAGGSLGADGDRAMAVAGAMGILPGICWTCLKLGFVAAAAAVLLGKSTRDFYSGEGAPGVVGVRGE